MEHIPVLLKECIDGLNIKPEGIYVDGTLGRAGHSKEIVKRLTTGKLIAIDRDMKAIEEAGENLKEYKDKIIYVHSNFSRIGEILDDLSIDKVDGMLFDLGVSSPQLDEDVYKRQSLRHGSVRPAYSGRGRKHDAGIYKNTC